MMRIDAVDTAMPAYVEPAEWHRSASHRMVLHAGALEGCAPCNRPVDELIADRAAGFAAAVRHPDNRSDATLAELTRWYLADREDIAAGRPLRYVPDL